MKYFLILIFLFIIVGTAKAESFIPSTFEGEFVQTKTTVHSLKKSKKSRKLKSIVQIKYKKPGNIYFKDTSTRTLYICNTKKVYEYQPPFLEGEQGNLKYGDATKFCYAKLFDSLNYGLVSNKMYTVKKIGKLEYSLTFKNNAKKRLGIEKLKLNFNKNEKKFDDLKSFSIYWDGQKNPVQLTRKSLKINMKFPKETFDFTAPKNTLEMEMN